MRKDADFTVCLHRQAFIKHDTGNKRMRRSGVQEWRLDSASTCVDTQHQVGVRQAQSWEERRNDNMEIKVTFTSLLQRSGDMCELTCDHASGWV